MEKVFMRFDSIPKCELNKAVQWFSDTYLKESDVKPLDYIPSLCTAIRTAPDRESTRTKWWWTDGEMLSKLKGFTEVFYNYLGDW